MCSYEKIKAFDLSYLCVFALLLITIIVFADNRLPELLYFNSKSYYQAVDKLSYLETIKRNKKLALIDKTNSGARLEHGCGVKELQQLES